MRDNFNLDSLRNPIDATFELTVRCNLKCKMCMFRHCTSENNELIFRELTAEEWIKIAEDAAKMGTGRRDSVTVKKCTFSQIRKGDIVLFSPADNMYLLHRVIKKTDENFVTAGDGNTFTDGIFTADKIIAVVSEIHRKNKTFSADKITFRFLSFIWMLIFPVRKPFLAIFKKAKKL